MFDAIGRGDAEMNLIGLILIAVLSGGIVVVSLRLRASSTSEWMWMEANRLHDEDRHSPANQLHDRGKGRFRNLLAISVSRFFTVL